MLWEASAVDICFVLESSPASFSGGACIVFHTFLTHGICFLWHLCVLEWLSESLHTLSLCLSCLSLCLSCLSLCVSSFSAWLPIVTNLSVKFPGLKLRVCKKMTKNQICFTVVKIHFHQLSSPPSKILPYTCRLCSIAVCVTYGNSMTYFFALNFYLSSENNGLATDSFKPLYFSSENDE